MASRGSVMMEQMVDVTEKVGMLLIALRGDLNAEIDALKQERAGLADDLARLGTDKEIAQRKSDADAYVADAQAKADGLKKSAMDLGVEVQKKLDDVQLRETGASALEINLSSREADLSFRTAALDDREKAIKLAQLQTENGLTARAAALDAKEKFLNEAKTQLDADRNAFNDKLAALRA